MKKFRLETGHVITVDDCDAYLLRSTVWVGYTSSSGGGLGVFRKRGAHDTTNSLAHYLGSQSGLPCVIHINGDACDFRRANLKACTREEMHAHVCSVMRATRDGQRDAPEWRRVKKA